MSGFACGFRFDRCDTTQAGCNTSTETLMVRIKSQLPTLLAAGVALALAACGDAPSAGVSTATAATQTAAATPAKAAPAPTSRKSPMPRACTLVSDAEAAALLAQEVGKMDDSPENCMWASAGSPGRITMLLVQPMQLDSAAEAESMFETLVEGLDVLNKTVNDAAKQRTRKSGVTLDGIGDAAWRSSGNVDLVGTQRLIARKGTRILVINITGSVKGTGMGERLDSLAKTAVAKM
jgi:hypothetical protein